MSSNLNGRSRVAAFVVVLTVAAALLMMAGTTAFAADMHTSGRFAGPKANTGTVSHSVEGGKSMLTLSADFTPPDTPDPHWQLVDSKGNVYLLQRLMVKPDKLNKSIEIPGYVHDVAKVQIWCAFAEVVLGEASFDKPVK